MPRLIVNAVPAETVSIDSIGDIAMYVSVSRADNGKPVTGLSEKNFQVGTLGLDLRIATCAEIKYASNESSGCYELDVAQADASPWSKGEYYQFVVQARVFKGKALTGCGQAAVNVQSLGT